MSNQVSSSMSFIYGPPVPPSEFLNREAELRAIFNRLRSGQSTAIVGEPHIGKSSLLLKLADETTQRVYLDDRVQGLVVSLLKLHHISNDYMPTTFWEKALKPLRERPGHITIAQRLQQVAEVNYAGDSLEDLFDYLSAHKRRLVLLLDEFEQLLFHSNFRNFAFFATLRALDAFPSFSFITTSRLSLKELNERGNELPGSGGSPLFNTQIELRLRPFDESTVDALLNRAGDAFSLNDRRFIRRVAGRHPFLLQAMAATLLETTGDDRWARAAETFYGRISSHFDDLWRTMDDRTRTTAVILSLVELGGHALGQDFAYGEIERVNVFGPELRDLAERGLAEQVSEGWQLDWSHLLLWQGKRWTIGTQAFAWWVRDMAIAETRRVTTYDEWLEKKRYHFFLTQAQWDRLADILRTAPEWAVQGIGALGRALFDRLMGR